MNVVSKTDTSVQETTDSSSTSQLEPEASAHIMAIRAHQNSHHVTASHIFPQNPSCKSHPFFSDQSVTAQPPRQQPLHRNILVHSPQKFNWPQQDGEVSLEGYLLLLFSNGFPPQQNHN